MCKSHRRSLVKKTTLNEFERCRYLEFYVVGGEAGIRTLGRAFRPYNGLANRRLQPLGHLTAVCKYTYNRHLRKRLDRRTHHPAWRSQPALHRVTRERRDTNPSESSAALKHVLRDPLTRESAVLKPAGKPTSSSSSTGDHRRVGAHETLLHTGPLYQELWNARQVNPAAQG